MPCLLSTAYLCDAKTVISVTNEQPSRSTSTNDGAALPHTVALSLASAVHPLIFNDNVSKDGCPASFAILNPS